LFASTRILDVQRLYYDYAVIVRAADTISRKVYLAAFEIIGICCATFRLSFSSLDL